MAGVDELAAYVAKARIVSDWSFEKHGAHQSYLLVLEGGLGVLAKPEDEIQNVGSVLVRREAAAWVAACLLGWPDLVAVTVLRQLRSFKTGIDVTASLQILWPFPEWLPAVATLPDEEVWQAAAFDAVIRHTDRSNNNWLGVPGAGHGVQVHLRLCDHGYGFEPGLAAPNSDFFKAKQAEKLPDSVIAALKSLLTQFPGALQGLLLDRELAGIRERTEFLLSKNELGFP
jgi:hypothetical protein